MKYYFSIVTYLLVLAACSSNNSTDEIVLQDDVQDTVLLTEKQFQSSQMELGKIESIPFNDVVKATGMFDVPPENYVSVSSYFGGVVKQLRLLPGQRVQKGQTLFIIENPDFIQIQEDYLEAKSQLIYLQPEYIRQKNLVKDSVSSQKVFLKAQSEYMVTKVKLEAMAKKLKLMNINPANLNSSNIRTTLTITSPVNGYITNMNITSGAFLNPSANALTIVNTDHLHIEINIFEKDITKVKNGQPIRFSVQNNPNHFYNASVYLIHKEVDPEKRTIGIHAHLENEETLSKIFTPGMYVEADILTSNVIKAAIPKDALVDLDGKYYALVLINKTKDGYSFIQKEIKPGESNTTYTEILNLQDFDANTQFLTKGAFNLIKDEMDGGHSH